MKIVNCENEYEKCITNYIQFKFSFKWQMKDRHEIKTGSWKNKQFRPKFKIYTTKLLYYLILLNKLILVLNLTRLHRFQHNRGQFAVNKRSWPLFTLVWSLKVTPIQWNLCSKHFFLLFSWTESYSNMSFKIKHPVYVLFI